MRKNVTPWAWVPTLYFAEGLPYFLVNVISVTMFKRLGMDNAELAFYTGLLYLPWVAKPLWGPFVDLLHTRRWWVLATQATLAATFAALAAAVAPASFAVPLALFYVAALASATHDIAADGYYMAALDGHGQSLFVGLRATFYRISSVFAQGVLVVAAGLLEERLGDVPRAWALTLGACSGVLALLALYHAWALPRAEVPPPAAGLPAREALGAAWAIIAAFFSRPGAAAAVAFLLLYRLPEALCAKVLQPFLLDPREVGGLALSTAQSGLVYGTVGVVALLAGGVLGGLAAARWGLQKCLWPMALCLAVPCAAYLYLALARPPLPVVYACVAFDQLGYGFGFTACLLFMMWFSRGRHATAHYALCTAFMALGMMLPGAVAGWLQERLGYAGFFAAVLAACLGTVAAALLVRVDPGYGRQGAPDGAAGDARGNAGADIDFQSTTLSAAGANRPGGKEQR